MIHILTTSIRYKWATIRSVTNAPTREPSPTYIGNIDYVHIGSNPIINPSAQLETNGPTQEPLAYIYIDIDSVHIDNNPTT